MVATKRLVRTLRGMRMDQPDFQRVAERTPIDIGAQLFQGFLVGGDAPPGSAVVTSLPKALIIEGFVVTDSVLALTITGGNAILTRRTSTGVEQGNLLTGGDASKTIDMTSDPDDTYKVFVRFDLRDDANENRIFWNAVAVTPVETPQNIPTRLVENWNVVVERVAPSDEWIEIASVVKSGGALVVTDTRSTFFEGDPANSHVIQDAEWGSASDRADDRSNEGIVGLRRGWRALQRQIQDIIGGTDAGPRHWARALDASKGLYEMFAKDGSRDMEGNINADVANTLEIGDLRRFLGVFSSLFTGDTINLGALNLGSFSSSIINRIAADYRDVTNGSPAIAGASQSRTLLFNGRALTGTVDSRIRIYLSNAAAQYGSTAAAHFYNLEICFNCIYNASAPNDSWLPDSTGAPALKLDISRDGIRFNQKVSPPAGGWRDDGALGDSWDNGNAGLDYSAALRLLTTDALRAASDYGRVTVAVASFAKGIRTQRNTAIAGGTVYDVGAGLSGSQRWNCSFALVGTTFIRITLDHAMENDKYVVQVTNNDNRMITSGGPFHAFIVPGIQAKTTTTFDIYAFEHLAGGVVDWTATDFEMSFTVHGNPA